MTTAGQRQLITEPGVYTMPAGDYHADPVEGGSLSSTGARRLLDTCPAKFHYERTHRPAPTEAMTFGHAAHKMVLGEGPTVIVVEADDWRTKAAKEAKADALEAGLIPMLRKDMAVVSAMAEALTADPIAGRLLAAARAARREAVLVWRCRATGINCRAMVDILPDEATPGVFTLLDYKTCEGADLDSIERSVWNYGYHIQEHTYLDGVKTLGLADKPEMAFIFQERTPPYLVRAVYLDMTAKDAGAFYTRQSRQIYRDCTESGVWPGYDDDLTRVSIPPWAQNRYYQESGGGR